MKSFDEFVSDLTGERSATASLINQAIKIAEDKKDTDLIQALDKVKAKFESVGPLSKKKLNKAVLLTVQKMAAKLKKDRDYLKELAKGGVRGDEVLAWTNQRLGQ